MNQRSNVISFGSPADAAADAVVSPTNVYIDSSLVREDRINAAGGEYDSYHRS
jgi:hypothetical protein